MPAFGLCISRNRADAPQAHGYYSAYKIKSERRNTPLANPPTIAMSKLMKFVVTERVG